MERLKPIIETLLFVAEGPLPLERIHAVLPEADPVQIRTALTELADSYEARLSGIRLSEVAGGYQLRTRSEYQEYVKRLVQPPPVRLSRAALETLAIVAYRQPIIRADIEQIRGVDCGGVLRMLLERKLVRVLGRKEIPGRPLIYATTRQFLETFDLKDLKDLPSPREIEELRRSALEGERDTEPEAPGPPPAPAASAPEAVADAGEPAAAADTPVKVEPDAEASAETSAPLANGPEEHEKNS